MNALTRIDSISALNRALVGFDKMFSNIETQFSNHNNYPPHNIEKISENVYRVVFAVAGFSQDEISVEVDQNELIIQGEKKESQDSKVEYIHRGLAFRNFKRVLPLAEHMEVVGAEVKSGLLSIQIERNIPEKLLPKKIKVIDRN